MTAYIFIRKAISSALAVVKGEKYFISEASVFFITVHLPVIDLDIQGSLTSKNLSDVTKMTFTCVLERVAGL